MNIDIGGYDDRVHSGYTSALEPSGWTDSFGAIGEVFDTRKALLFTSMPAQSDSSWNLVAGIPAPTQLNSGQIE